jgi:outer membrane receptor protein involved in Fe transport
MSTQKIWNVLGFAIGLLAMAGTLVSQTNLATVRGRVTDSQGGLVVSATVTAVQVDTNLTRTTQTDAAGQYLIASLPAGPYDITFRQSGFGDAKVKVTLEVGQESTVDAVLHVAGVQQSIDVSSTAAVVQTENTVEMEVTPKQLNDLPTFNRSFGDLAQLAPGINSTGSGSMGFSAAGQRQYQNNVLVDGGTNAMQFYGTQADTYPQDWIQEFQVMTNGYSAEYGHASGAFLNVITKSGTNDFHGRAYGFFQNAVLNAPPYAGHFTNNEPQFLSSTPPYNQYRVGGYLGGPIIKNKLFFFGGFEDLNNSQTTTLSISQYWINQGVQYIIPEGYTLRPLLAKADWNINSTNRLTVRYDRTNQTLHNCSGQIGQGCDNQPNWTLQSRGLYTGPIWSTVAALTSTFGSRAFNEFRFYYGVNKVSIFSNITGDKLGGASLLADTSQLGLFSEKTYPGAHFGSGSLGGLEGESNMYFDDDFSYLIGKHQLKFGAEISRPVFDMNIDASQHGRWYFAQDLAFNINNPASYPYEYIITLGVPDDVEAHTNGAIYVEDTWKVRDNLTINLGLRWEVDTTVETGNQLVAGYNQRIESQYGGGPVAFPINPDLHDFSPRLGLVWAPTADRRTTLRVGAGTFYDQNHYNYSDIALNQTLLNRGRYQFNSNVPSQNPFYNPANPAGSAATLKAFLASNFPNSPNLTAVGLLPQAANLLSPNFRTPYTEQLTAGVTHQFTSGLYIQGDFVYSHGRDQVIDLQTNLVPATPGDARFATAFVSNDPRYSQITYYKNLGWTQYTAMQTRLAYNLGTRLHLDASYTLAKTTSNTIADGIGGGLATNPYNLSLDDGPDDQDRRHNVTADLLYTFPHGLEISGLFHYGSPFPYTVTSIYDTYIRPEPRNDRRGDDYDDTDIRASKIFRLTERFQARIFWEVFNLFNARNFYNYQGSLQSSQFGQPQSMFPSRAQQGGFRLDF